MSRADSSRRRTSDGIRPPTQMGPAATKGPVTGRLHHLWRVGFMYFAWYTTRGVVAAKNRATVLRWLGGDSREMAVRLWTVAWLTFVWVLLWGTLSWANVLGGVVLAAIVLTVLPLPRVPVEGRIHLAVVGLLVVYLIRDFFVSSAEVAWLAVRPGRPPLSAVLRARLAIKSDMVLTLAVDYLNLVPGTMVVQIDHRRRLLYVHVIDVSTDKKVREFYREMARIERLFIRAFERDSEWHPSPYHGVDDDFHHAATAVRRSVGATSGGAVELTAAHGDAPGDGRRRDSGDAP